MKNLVDKFLTEEEKQEIILAAKDAEKLTSGEIVPMVVPSSYHYPAPQMTGMLALGLVLSIGAAQILGMVDMWSFITLFLAAYILSGLVIKNLSPFKRLFVSPEEMQEEVEEAALGAFYKNGLGETRDKTGVLIYISVFERKVWVLADSGINAKVEENCWKEIVEIITRGIKEGRQGEAICMAVGRCGEILSAHFPRKEDDRDELTNLIIEK